MLTEIVKPIKPDVRAIIKVEYKSSQDIRD